jgi:hypothetical protein
MDTETTGAENTLPEQQALRKPGRAPPIMTTSTTNLISLRTDSTDHVKEEYKFRNTQNGTHIMTKEMEIQTGEQYFHHFTFSPNSEKPTKAVIHHLPPDMPAEDISSSLEDLDFNVFNVRQMTATQTGPNGQIHMEPLPLLLITLTRNTRDNQAE